jgi:hypothetical protein
MRLTRGGTAFALRQRVRGAAMCRTPPRPRPLLRGEVRREIAADEADNCSRLRQKPSLAAPQERGDWQQARRMYTAAAASAAASVVSPPVISAAPPPPNAAAQRSGNGQSALPQSRLSAAPRVRARRRRRATRAGLAACAYRAPARRHRSRKRAFAAAPPPPLPPRASGPPPYQIINFQHTRVLALLNKLN